MRSVCVRGMAAGECRPSGVVARSRCRVPGARRQGPRALGPASGGGAGLLLVAAPAWSRDERQAWPVPMTWSARGGRGSTDAGRATRAEQREQSRARPRELALAVLGDGGACGLGWAARRHRARRAGGGGGTAVGDTAVATAGLRSRLAARARRRGARRAAAARAERLLGSRAGHAAPHLEWVFHVEHPANRASLSAPARLLQHVRRGPGRCAQRAPCGEPGKLSRAEEDVGRHVKHAPRGSGPGRARGAHASRARSGGRRGAEDWRIGGRRRTWRGHEEREAGRADAEREAPGSRGTGARCVWGGGVPRETRGCQPLRG
jgi:hypothetical protein